MKVDGFLSKYLKASDFPKPALYTIERVDEEDMQDGGSKLVVYFTEVAPGVVLGKTTIELIVDALGADDTDDWIGCPIVVYNDPTVQYQGRKTGGIRFRKPKGSHVKKIIEVKATVHGAGGEQEEVPF